MDTPTRCERFLQKRATTASTCKSQRTPIPMLAAEQTRNEHVNSLGPDAALCITDRHGSQRIHFFKGRQLVEWNVDADAMVDGSLRDIDDRYPGLLARGFERRIRAALHVPEWGPRIFFLFEGTKEFIVWDCAHGASREAAIPSQELLPCTLPAGEFTPVVAMTAAGQR